MAAGGPLSTSASVAWTLLGRISSAAAQAVLVILCARLGSATMVGQLALAMTICSPVMVLAGLQLRVVYVTDAQGRFSERTYARVRWLSTGAGVVGLGIIAAAQADSTLGVVLLAVAVGKAIEHGQDLEFAVFQRRGHMNLYGQSLVGRSVLASAAVWVGLRFTQSLAVAMLGAAAAWLFVYVVLDRPRARWLRAHQPRASSGLAGPRQLFAAAAPLGLVALLDSISQNIVRFQLDHIHGTELLGHYTTMSYVVVAGGAVIFSITAPVLPGLARNYADDRSAFNRSVARLLAISGGLGALGIAAAAVLGNTFLLHVYGPAFTRYGGAFTWIMAAGALQFILTVLVNALHAAQQRALQPAIYGLGFVATLAFGALWIPDGGVYGAAYASLAGWATAATLAAALLVRQCRAPFPAGEGS